MKIELRKWGNSLGLRIPSKIAQTMGLDEHSTVELNQADDNTLILKKKQAIDLDELIASIPDNFAYPDDVQDFVNSEPRGDELL